MTRPARFAVMPNARRRNQRRVHQRAGSHYHAVLIELAGDGFERRAIKPAAHQLGTQADEGGALGRRVVRCKAAEAAKTGPIVSSDSARRTSDRSCHIASSRARNNASGGQPNSPLADDEIPASKPSNSAQSTSLETSASDLSRPTGSHPTASRSCPICRRHSAPLPLSIAENQSAPRRLNTFAHRSHYNTSNRRNREERKV
jgi:hypothetical protein